MDPPLADFTPSGLRDAAVRQTSLYDPMIFILAEPSVKLLGQRPTITILRRGASHDGDENSRSEDQREGGLVTG